MTARIGVQLETCGALEDAKEFIDERGLEVKINTNNETNVDRDKYGSIKKRTSTVLTFNAFPVTFNPSSDQVKRAGIREDVDVLVTFATKDFTNNSLGYKDIDHTRWEIELEDRTYSIKDINQINHFSSSYLNIVVGLVTK